MLYIRMAIEIIAYTMVLNLGVISTFIISDVADKWRKRNEKEKL